MKYNFDEYIARRGTGSLKWDSMGMDTIEGADKAIPMGLADMDFRCAPQITAAVAKRLEHGIMGYSLGNTGEYLDSVCGWFNRRFGWKVDSGHIIYSPGVVPALGFLIEILTDPGDGVIIQQPVYHFFFEFAESHGRKVVNNPLINRDGRYEMDFADLERKAADPNNRLMILCSPHNPVGRVWNEDELKRAARICMENDVTIISDEIHCDLTRCESRHIPLAKLVPEYGDRIITCTAPSKTFNLAGIQLSNIIIHDEILRNKWYKYVLDLYGLFGGTALAYPAAIAAYNESEDWLEQLKVYLDSNIRYVYDYLGNYLPKAVVSPCEGTYLIWVDLRAWNYSREELKAVLHDGAGVLVAMGNDYGEEGDGFIRINAACPEVLLKEGLRRLIWALDNLRPGQKAPSDFYRTPWLER
jgi:cystathionine beta-lyase